jgi:hypothetical protein
MLRREFSTVREVYEGVCAFKAKDWYFLYCICLSGLVAVKETQRSPQKTGKHTDKTKPIE